jgi:hypothetical protein
VSLSPNSFSVPTSATPLPIAAVSPGSIVLINTGPNAITIGGPNVTAGAVGPGSATIPNGGVVHLERVGGVAAGSLYGIAATGASVLNWFYGTDVNS